MSDLMLASLFDLIKGLWHLVTLPVYFQGLKDGVIVSSIFWIVIMILNHRR